MSNARRLLVGAGDWIAARPSATAASVFFLVNLFGLTRSPVVWIDEVTLNSPAHELVEHGRFASGVFGETLGYDAYYFWQPPGLAIVTALAYRALGFGILQTRLLPLAFAGAAVYCVGWITTSLSGSRRAGLLASLLLAVDPRFITTARGGRMDTIAIALLLTSVGLLLHRSRRYSAIAGLTTSAAALTHPLAAIWIVPLSVIAWRRPSASVRLFALGATIPVAVWLAWMIPGRDAFADQFVRHGTSRTGSAALIARVLGNAEHFIRNSQRSPVVPVLVVTVLYAGFKAWRSRVELAGPILLTVCAVGAQALLLLSWNAGWYEQYWLPAVYIAAGVLLTRVGRRGALAVISIAAILSAGIVSYGGRTALLVGTWQQRDYDVVEEFVARRIRPTDIVWGEPSAWYAVERLGAALRLRDSDSPSVPLPHRPDPALHSALLIQDPVHVDEDCFRALGYRFVARVQGSVEPTYRLALWRLAAAPRSPDTACNR